MAKRLKIVEKYIEGTKVLTPEPEPEPVKIEKELSLEERFLEYARKEQTVNFPKVAAAIGSTWREIKKLLDTRSAFKDAVKDFLEEMKFQLADDAVTGKGTTRDTQRLNAAIKLLNSGLLLGERDVGKASGRDGKRSLGNSDAVRKHLEKLGKLK